MKLLIRNLARNTTEETVQALFAEHGAVQSCTLVMDKVSGGSKGFGFVEMPNSGEAKAAVKVLNASNVDGNVIRVKKAD
jgi:RNA recognition motif-containing protein|tara:strand:- start:859 stop:1095 length:237 start_codon:yes stop_codon:yes gene_type:complete